MKGWRIDVRKLYGWWGWRRRAQFHLTEEVFEAPGGGACAVLYHIGEVGLAGMAGHLAVYKDKRKPRKVFHRGGATYWYQGDETVRWSSDGGRAFLLECTEAGGLWGDPAGFDAYLTVLDLKRERWARPSRRLGGLPSLHQLDADVILVDAGSDAPGRRPRRVHFKRLDWMPFRWLGWF